MSLDSKRDSVSRSPVEQRASGSRRSSSEQQEENRMNSPTTLESNHSHSRSSSPKITRSQSHSSISSKHDKVVERPASPVTRRRQSRQHGTAAASPPRARSNSPRKTFSYLPPGRLNVRTWKQQHRILAKQDEEDRIYHENRLKLERLAKIAREPSAYPTMHLEQERQRERHALDHRRKLLKSYIPIYQDNLCIINRLAHVKGVYDTKKMDEDYRRHTNILRQDAANRKKARETAAQRPFILPKIHTKS